jgi:hypothetical protein
VPLHKLLKPGEEPDAELVVVNALSESSWGTFTVASTIPIAIFKEVRVELSGRSLRKNLWIMGRVSGKSLCPGAGLSIPRGDKGIHHRERPPQCGEDH